MRQHYSLRFKIIFQLCLVFVLGFLLQGYLGTSFMHKSYVQKLQLEQFNRVSTIADSLDRKLKSVHQLLISAATVLPVGYFDDAEFLQTWLDDRRGLSSNFDNGLFIFHPNGDLLAEAPFKPDRRGRSYSFRPYYQETVRTGQPYISDPYISSKKHNHPAMMMTAPIFDQQGNLLAILGGAFDLLGENFLGSLSKQKLGENGYFYLASLDRKIIIHPDSTRIMKNDIPIGVNLLFDRAMAGFEGCEETVNSRGLSALTAFKRLDSKNWVLGGNYPMVEINEPLLQARLIIWQVSGAIFLAILLLSIVSFQKIFKPLFLFTNHLENLPNKKDSDRLFSYHGTDEINILVTTFNKVIQETDIAYQALGYAQQMAHLGNWTWDVLDHTLTWSDEIFRIFGGTPQDYAPSYEIFLDKIHPEDRAAVEQAITQALEEKQTYKIEHRIIQEDGSVRYVRERCEVQCNAQGEPIFMIGTIQDINEVITLQNQLKELATIDELTGAVNRRQLFFLAETLLQRASRYDSTFSLLFYDLDHFKQVNDQYGHPAGDEVLQKVTAKVQDLLRATDTLARYGGEEFCVLAVEVADENSEILAEKIRKAVEEMDITLKAGDVLKQTISIGITSYQNADTVSSLIERADQAVYRAKELGRNRTFRC